MILVAKIKKFNKMQANTNNKKHLYRASDLKYFIPVFYIP